MSLALALVAVALVLAAGTLWPRRRAWRRRTDALTPDSARDTIPDQQLAAPPAPLDPIISIGTSTQDDDEPATLLYRGSALLALAELESPEPSHLDEPSRVQLCYEVDAEETEITSPRARILIAAQADSDRGKRRSENEDCVLFDPGRSLFAVADGMGGHAGGRVASHLAVAHLKKAFEQERFDGPLDSKRDMPRRARELASAVVQSHCAVRRAAQADPELSSMGTTLVAARFAPNNQRVYIAHVGDSRCYRFRAGRLRQLTVDHTMRQIGLVGPAADHLFQAIGPSERLDIDLIVDKPMPDDVYLLCSDGLTKMVEDDDICAQLLEESDIEAAVYALIESANDRGGRDNVSVVLVKVLERSVPSLATAGAAWSKLPSDSSAVWELGNEEPTVVGQLPLDEWTEERRTGRG